MKRILLLFLFIALANLTKGQNLSGIWCKTDSDLIYYEMHVSDSGIVTCNSATGGCANVYSYTISQDSIYLSCNNQLIDTIPFHLTGNDVLWLYFNENWYEYFRLKENALNYFFVKNRKENEIFNLEFFQRCKRIESSRK